MPTVTEPAISTRSVKFLNQALDRGYLIDDRYASDLAGAYASECWRNQLPSVVASPWRRNWYALRVDMPSAYRLSNQAADRLTRHIERAQAEAFRHQVRFLPGGFQVWGILPERIEQLAEIVATITNDPDQTMPTE